MCVSDVVRHFNKSPKVEIKILRRMGINPGTNTIAGFVASMENKDKNAKKHSTPEVKTRRRYLRGRKKLKLDRHEAA